MNLLGHLKLFLGDPASYPHWVGYGIILIGCLVVKFPQAWIRSSLREGIELEDEGDKDQWINDTGSLLEKYVYYYSFWVLMFTFLINVLWSIAILHSNLSLPLPILLIVETFLFIIMFLRLKTAPTIQELKTPSIECTIIALVMQSVIFISAFCHFINQQRTVGPPAIP